MSALLLRRKVVTPLAGCGDWGRLSAGQRSSVLARHADRAWRLSAVSMALVPWHEHVAVCALISSFPGRGYGSRVLTGLCRWADCARVTLELTPCGAYGCEVERLTTWFAGYGWSPNFEVPRDGLPKQMMIRYPVAGRGHRRCGASMRALAPAG